MKTNNKSVLAAVICAFSMSASAEDAMMIQVKRLSLDTATKMAQAAVAACREKGIQIGVTVVDRDGTEQAVLRDTIAAPITIPISKGKAVTAANFSVATSALGDRADSPVGRVPGLIMSAGGIPVQVGGAMVGAIGVSGAPSGETDAECAQAGIDAVLEDLEMAM